LVEGFVLDTSALVASFYERPDLEDVLTEARAGRARVYLPTVAISDTETDLRAGINGWAHLMYEEHIISVPLSEICTLEIGSWPGTLAARHTAHEAKALRARVVTLEPKVYEGLGVTPMAV
jgi:hypothetical protein